MVFHGEIAGPAARYHLILQEIKSKEAEGRYSQCQFGYHDLFLQIQT
jgi:hypothetical protein